MVERPTDPAGSNASDERTRSQSNAATTRRTLLKTIPAVGLVSATSAVGRVAAIDRPTVDTTDQQNATFSGSDGDYTIEAAGANIWTNQDEYGAIYEPDSFEAGSSVVVTVESQENTDDWAKAGVMVANDMTAGGGSVGDVGVMVTPSNGIRMQWDSDGDGYMDAATTGTSTFYPCTLKIERRGDTFIGYYSTDGGANYTVIDSVTIPRASSIQDGGMLVNGRDELCTVDFSGFRFVDERTVDTTDQQNAMFSGSDGTYTIEAAGANIWTNEDEYGAIYEADSFDSGGSVVATVESQEYTDEWAKAGVMIANDMTDRGGSVGDVGVMVTPSNGIRMQWDSDGDGYMDSYAQGMSTTYPCTLKVERSGNTFTGYYSTDGGVTFELIDEVTITAAKPTQDAGLFANGRDHLCTVEYNNFRVVDRPTVDTTDQQTATFQRSGTRYTIEAAGANIWTNEDEYGAIYEADSFESGGSVVATVESQENTDKWAKAGVMVANDMSAGGGSIGDVGVMVTPSRGIRMQWDSDGDGYMDSYANAIDTTYPCTLKVERSGNTFTGYYSTDGGDTYTSIREVTIDVANASQDAGIFANGRDELCTVVYGDFSVGPKPLPSGSDALDRLVFGNAGSEAAHSLAPETSEVVAGQHATLARAIQYPNGYGDDGVGSLSFTVDCDPNHRTYLTIKMAANPDGSDGPRPLFLFDGDEIVGYNNERTDWPSLGSGRLFTPQPSTNRQVQVQRAEWVYVTAMLPTSMTDGQETVDIRLGMLDWWDAETDPPSNPIYRAYTHTNPLFPLPSDENDTLGRDLGTPQGAGSNPTQKLVEKAEAMVDHGQSQSRVSAKAAEGLSRAYSRGGWITTVDQDAIFATVRDTVDYWVKEQAKDGVEPSDLGDWSEHGHWARGVELLAETFENRGALSEEMPDHPDAPITRRTAYTDFFREAYDWRKQDREFITNQVMIVSTALISMGDVLQFLNESRAPSQEEIDRLTDEAFGVKPMTNLFGSGKYDSGIWHTLSEQGLNREGAGYSGGYGSHPPVRLLRVAHDTNADRLKERLSANVEGMGEFRWRAQAAWESDRRFATQEYYLGGRGGFHVGSATSLQGYGVLAPAYAALLGEEDEVVKRWAELQLEHGNHDFWEAPETGFNKYPDSRTGQVHRMIFQKEGIDAVQNMSDSTYALPWERDRSVWADPQQGMVSIVDGDHRLLVSLGHSNGSHISDTVAFDYAGPDSDRVGVTELRRKEFPLYETRSRPNTWHTLKNGSGSYYLPWKDATQDVDQALRGESLPLASKPNGDPWPDMDNAIARTHPYVGICYHYREARIGPYLIGMNSTGAPDYGFAEEQYYDISLPSGTVLDLESGKELTCDTETIFPEQTRVFKVL